MKTLREASDRYFDVEEDIIDELHGKGDLEDIEDHHNDELYNTSYDRKYQGKRDYHQAQASRAYHLANYRDSRKTKKEAELEMKDAKASARIAKRDSKSAKIDMKKNLINTWESEQISEDVKMSVSLLIKMLEYAREEAKNDLDLHKATEHIVSLLDKKDCLDIDDYKKIIKECQELDDETKIKLNEFLTEKANNATDSETLRRKAEWHEKRFGSKMNGASLAKAGKNRYRAELQDKGFKFNDFDDMREAEQIDEISKKKASEYLEKVPDNLKKNKDSDKTPQQKRKTLLNRKEGSIRAISRLAKESEDMDLYNKLAATKDHSAAMQQHMHELTKKIVSDEIRREDAQRKLKKIRAQIKEDQMTNIDSKSAVQSNVRQKRLRQGGVTKMSGVAPANKPQKNSLGNSSGNSSSSGLDATNGNSQKAGVQK